MTTLSAQSVLEALRFVKDPDLHRDIVSLDFVKNLEIEGSDVAFTIELTTPACPVREEMKAASIAAIREHIKGVGTIEVKMTSKVIAHDNKQKASVLPGVKNTIAVASGKGGVGKSTVAVNIAVALAKDGARVGLLDADVYGPSIPLMMGVKEKPQMRDQRLIPVEKWGVKVMSIGFFIESAQAVIWRGPMLGKMLGQFIGDVEWGELDYLVFDLPPGTGDIQLSLAQALPLTGAVVVTTPQDVSLSDVRRAMQMLEKVSIPILGIVENMSYYVCSHCGHREEIFDHGGGKKTAAELGVPFLGGIPIHTSIRISGDSGRPIVMDEERQREAEGIMQIARLTAAQVSIRNARQATSQVEISLLGEKD
jgi:ATP-binding protein involved in chromosome partitioning